MMPACVPLAIVGGGLAGLATAIALRTVGIRADVFEAAPALGEVGAAVNVSPQAVKALAVIGLGEALARVGDPSRGVHTRDMATGAFVEFSDRPAIAERFGAPFYTVHRADLMTVLADGADKESLHLGKRLVGVEERGDGVLLDFADGSRCIADHVIAADGVRSVVRQALYDAAAPSYTGQMVWRALLDAATVPADLLEPSGHVQWVGPGSHFIAYYIRHGALVNIVTQQDTGEWVEEGWSIRGDPEAMRASFPGAEPRMAALLDRVTACSKWGLFTRPINDEWGQGRIQLIGDAAHAMLPNAGQGACQAFEDAYVLARWLAASTDPSEAFAAFRRVRVPRVHGVQRLSLASARSKHRHAAESGFPTASVHGDASWVWGYDPVADWDREPVVPAAYAPR